MRVHEEIDHRARADMELRQIDAAVEKRGKLTGGEARLNDGKRAHGVGSKKPRAWSDSGT